MATPTSLISGLANNLAQLSSCQRDSIAEIRLRLANEGSAHPNVVALADYLRDESNLVRFLIAREWDVSAAQSLLLEALAWRAVRPVHRWFVAGPTFGDATDTCDDESAAEHATCAEKAELFRRHASLGKIRVPGVDIHGRALLVLDSSRENISDPAEQMAFLGWNLELCKRTMEGHHANRVDFIGPCPDKIVVFLHLTDFSLWTQPSMSVTRETITILSTVFPESMASVVVLNPPAYFTSLYAVVSSLMDARTRSKVLLLPGGAGPGSASDLKLREMIGPNWRALTGAGQPMVKGWSERLSRMVDASPGFSIDRYWPTVLDREAAAWRRRSEAQGAAVTSSLKVDVTNNGQHNGSEDKTVESTKGVIHTSSERFRNDDADDKISPISCGVTSGSMANSGVAAPGQAVRNADDFAGAFRGLRALGHGNCTVAFSFLKQQHRGVVVAFHDARGFGLALDKASLKVQWVEPKGQVAEAGVSKGWQLVAVRLSVKLEGTNEVCTSGKGAVSNHALEEDEVPVRVSEDLRTAVGQFKKAGHTHAELVFTEVAAAYASVVFDLAHPLAMKVHPEKLQVTSVAASGQASAGGVEPGWRVETVGPCSHEPMAACAAEPESIPATLFSDITNVASILEDDESAMPAVAVVPAAAAVTSTIVAAKDPLEITSMNMNLGTVAVVICAAVAVASLGTLATVAMIGFLASIAFVLDRLRSTPRNECLQQVSENTRAPYETYPTAGATGVQVPSATLNASSVKIIAPFHTTAENVGEFDGWRPEWDDTFIEDSNEAIKSNGSARSIRTNSEKKRSESELDLLLELWASFEKEDNDPVEKSAEYKASAAYLHCTVAREWACDAGVRRRYLKSAKGDPMAASLFLIASCEWRAQHGVDSLLDDPHAIALEQRQRPLLKYHLSQCTSSSACGATSTLLIERVGAWDLQALKEHAVAAADENDALALGYCRFGLKGLLLGHVVVNELIQRAPKIAAAAELKSRAGGFATASYGSVNDDPANLKTCTMPAAIDESMALPKVVAVLDLNGMGTGHLAATRLQGLFGEIAKLDTQHYPEFMGHIVVVNALPIFGILANAMTRLLHPDTRAKITVFGSGQSGDNTCVRPDAAAHLIRLCGADALPAELGGTLPPKSPPYNY